MDLFKNWWGFLLMAVAMACLLWWNASKIEYDWDLPGYLGSVEKITEQDPEKIHQAVYDDLKLQSTNQEWEKIIGKNPAQEYRSAMQESAVYFNKQLPYYQIKTVYVHSIKGIDFFVGNKIRTVYALNMACLSALFFLIYFYFKSIIKLHFWFSFALSFGLMVFLSFSHLVTSSTPDLMVYMLVTALVLSFFKPFPILLQMILSWLIIGTRPDYVVFLALYLPIAFYFSPRKHNSIFALAYLSIFLVYFALIRIFDYPGWKAIFYDTFIQRRIDLSTEVPPFGFEEYFSILIEQFLHFKKITIVSILSLSAAFIAFKKRHLSFKNLVLSSVFFLNSFVKFLLFPASGDPRFFLIFLLLIFLMLFNPNHAIEKKA